MGDTRQVTVRWADVLTEVRRIARTWTGHGIDGVYGIPRGGSAIAPLIAERIPYARLLDRPDRAESVLVVDDLVESGATMARHLTPNVVAVDVLYVKPHSPRLRELVGPDRAYGVPHVLDAWVEFPWEANEAPAEDAARRIWQHLGAPDRDPHALLAALDGPLRDLLWEATGG